MRPIALNWLAFFFFVVPTTFSFGQQTPRMTSGGIGYLEKLPPDYTTNPTRKYPVLFFLHGAGEVGNGSATDLQKVKAHGPPNLIEAGHNMCFTVNGVEECFIVISPQLRPGTGGWWPSIQNDVFDYVLNGPFNYRIDRTRVYLTGLSLGGQGVYIGVGDAAVPDIFAAGAAASAFGNGNGCRISSRKIPMWGFHGTADGTIPYSTGLNEFNNIVNCTTPVPTAELKWTPYVGLGHNIWTNYAFRTDNNLATPNLYQWLLTKSKGNPPTAQAGGDITLILPTNAVSIVGTGTANGGATITNYTWAKISGGAATLSNVNSLTLNVTGLVEGSYIFRLTVTDSNGLTASDDVSVLVVTAPNLVINNPTPVCAPSTVNITIPGITAGSSPGLTLTYWQDAGATVVLTNPNSVGAGTYFIRATNASGLFIIKPVQVTVNPLPALVINNPSPVCEPNKINITDASITLGSAPNLFLSYWTDVNATNALTNPTAVSAGTHFIRGQDVNGCFQIKPVITTINIQPLLPSPSAIGLCNGGTTNISLSTTNGTASTFTWTASVVNGQATGFSGGSGNVIQEQIQTNNLGATVRYTYSAVSTIGLCPSASSYIDVNVGAVPTAAINLQASTSVVCNGCSTNVVLLNPNNVAGTTFSWVSTTIAGTVSGQSSGSGSVIIQSLSKTTALGEVRFDITPKSGSCSGAAIQFNVRVNNSPTVSAGGDRTIILPTSSITLNGSATDSDGSISSVIWTKVNGPSSFLIVGDNTTTPTISGLVSGVYQFRITARDNDDAIALNTMTLTVNGTANLPPVVSAGTDVILKFPSSEVKLTGTANDPDGTIKSTSWVQISGRETQLSENGLELVVRGLLVGHYEFKFSATDFQNATTEATVKVTVEPDDSFVNFVRKKFITPNGDNANDFWILDPDVTKYESCRLTILSNSGEKVFEAMGYLNNWDGTRGGNILPQDVYYYVCECKDRKETGSITIIR